MANLIETSNWETGIYQLETTDPVVGGANGISNLQAKQLANRTVYLKSITDEVITARSTYATLGNRLSSIETTIANNQNSSASQFSTINTQLATALANSGVTPGTYNNSTTSITPFTVDARGRITATGSPVTITPAWTSIVGRPTTIADFGIGDFYGLSSTAADIKINGTQSAGTSKYASRADHVHPTDTSRAAVVHTHTSSQISDATYNNTANTLVLRDPSGNFSAGTITVAGVTTTGNITIGGNLVVNGTTTTINSATLAVDDKNIELGTVDTPTDDTANGGGITLKGTTDKLITWNKTSGAWEFNQPIISNNFVRGSQLQSTVTTGTSPLTVASTTIVTNLNADLLDGYHATSFAASSHTHPSSQITDAQASNTAYTIVMRDGSGNFSAGTITANLNGNANTATNASYATTAGRWSTARTITTSGDVTGSVSIDGSGNVTLPITLNNSGVTPGTYNNSTTIYPFTVNAKGIITGIGAPITISTGSVTWSSIQNKPNLGNETISTAMPSGGSSGDKWFVVDA